MKRLLARRELVPALLVVLAFVVGAAQSPYFLDARYLLDASSLYVEAGLLALGMTLVIVSGHIDLSVAAMLALVACVVGKLLDAGHPPFLVLPGGLILGTFLGWCNGALIARLRLPSFVVTLATMAAYRGIAQALLGAESVKIPANLVGVDFATVPGTPIPVPLAILVVVAVLMGLLLHRTVLGRWIYADGTNERAAFFSGVPTQRVTTTVFALSGLMAGLAALLIDSRLGVARFDHARGLEVDVITAVVLGGTSIAGGSGSILGTMLALLLIGLLRTGMGVANVTAEYQLAAVGTLLVVAVLTGNLVERIAASRRSRAKE
jgi:rhamnose transport system permease protein